MNQLRDYFETKAGKATMIGLILVACVVVIVSFKGFFGSSEAARLSRQGLFIDATTGETFHYTLRDGDTIPVAAPSGQKTGYPAAMCYWNKDGSIRTDPVAVLVNEYLGKREPTFCPDCGRRVVGNAPPPMAGDPPPLTKAEWLARQGRNNGSTD